MQGPEAKINVEAIAKMFSCDYGNLYIGKIKLLLICKNIHKTMKEAFTFNSFCSIVVVVVVNPSSHDFREQPQLTQSLCR